MQPFALHFGGKAVAALGLPEAGKLQVVKIVCVS